MAAKGTQTELVGNDVVVRMCDRQENQVRGTLVALEPIGAMLSRVSRNQEQTLFIPMDKITTIQKTVPVSK